MGLCNTTNYGHSHGGGRPSKDPTSEGGDPAKGLAVILLVAMVVILFILFT